MKKIGVFDIEALNSEDFLNFQVGGFYDGLDMYYFYSIEEYINFILNDKYNGFKIYSHYGGKYDFLFLLNDLKHLRFDYNIEIKEIAGRIIEIKLSHKKNKFQLKMIDSFNIFQTSLAKLTKAFEVTHIKQTHNHNVDFIINDKNLKYLKYDCIGLYEVIEKYLKYININEKDFKITIASQSLFLYKKSYNNYDKDFIQLGKYEEFIRQGYHGGRSEVFNFKMGAGYYYDVNSLYPFVMLQKIPCGNFNSSIDIKKHGFYDVLIETSDTNYPILPYVLNGKLIFPVGCFRGIYASNELQFALDRGYKIKKVFKGLAFNSYKLLFYDYIMRFYEMKKNAKNETERYISKIHMNSLYGKFGQNRDLKVFAFLEELDLSYSAYDLKNNLFYKEIYNHSKDIIPSISAWITASARIELYKWFERINFDVFYCDTDSIFTTTKLQDKYVNDDIGSMKLEKTIKSANFNFCKDYNYFDTDENYVEKIKGFSKKVKNERMAGFKTAVKNISISEEKNNFLKKQKIQRNNKIKKYDKRIVIENNKTIPIAIYE